MAGERAAALHSFLSLTEAAIKARAGSDTPAAAAMRKVSAALAAPAPRKDPPQPRALPAGQHLLPAIAALERGPADLAQLAEAMRTLAPAIAWQQRSSDDAAFMQGHANGPIVGAEAHALEQRDDVRIGISLMAPHITYPDHRHPPEEVYIVLSPGDWRQGAGPWHAPGVGGIVYNPPDIIHAMRSGAAPLLAIWCLPVERRNTP